MDFPAPLGPSMRTSWPGYAVKPRRSTILRFAAGIGEADVLQGHHARTAALSRSGVAVRAGGASGDGRACVEHLEEPFAGRRGGGDAHGEPAEGLHLRIEVAEVGGEGQQSAHRQPARRDLPGARSDHRQDGQRLEDVGERQIGVGQPGAVQAGAHPVGTPPVHPQTFGLLLVVCLHHRHVHEVLVERVDQLPVPVALRTGQRPDRAGQPPRGQPQDGGRGEGQHGRLPAQPERGAREEDQTDGGVEQLHRTRGDHMLRLVDVTGEAGRQVAGRVVLVVVRGQPLRVLEHLVAAAQPETLLGTAGQLTGRERHGRTQQGHREPQSCGLPEFRGLELCQFFEFRSVRTRGPPSVIATVCSTWAAREPSFVRRVQPSAAAW